MKGRGFKLNVDVMPRIKGRKSFHVCVRMPEGKGRKFRPDIPASDQRRYSCADGRTPTLAVAAALSKLSSSLRRDRVAPYFKLHGYSRRRKRTR